jgi:hypothetical protein
MAGSLQDGSYSNTINGNLPCLLLSYNYQMSRGELKNGRNVANIAVERSSNVGEASRNRCGTHNVGT